MSDPRATWTRLGCLFAVEPAEVEPDLEEAIATALVFVRVDPRLFVGLATWLHRYGSLVDGHLLVRRLTLHPSPEERAVLGALITASSAPSLRGLRGRCQPLTQRAPLFHIMDRPVLRSKVQKEALPEYLKWGFHVDNMVLKPEALRPPSWVLRMNPALRIRALLGANVRAAVVTRLLAKGPAPSLSALARELGRSYPSIHAAVASLVAAGLLEQVASGRALGVRLPDGMADWLADYPGVRPPPIQPVYTAIPTVKGQVKDLRFVSVFGNLSRRRGESLEEGEWQVQYRFEDGGGWLTADTTLRVGEGLSDSVTCDPVNFKKCVVRR